MHNITLISTIHKEYGKCNADELCNIIESIEPEVIFLEATEDSYSAYARFCFTQFGVFHERLEIKAIQKHSLNHRFEYIPALDTVLSEAFSKMVCEYDEYRKLLYNSYLLATEYGFQFLNSEKSIQLQKEMRELENVILNNNEICQKADISINAYENSMLRNIYAYSKENTFNKAIFMCGAAHRSSIMQKIQEYESKEDLKLNWEFYS